MSIIQENVIFHWSGGKDSALALHKLILEGHEIRCLLTSISGPYRRISMHGVREALVDQQAERLGIPLVKMCMPDIPTMQSYERNLMDTLVNLQSGKPSISAFGDIYLEDLRKYREEFLATIGMKTIFPLWNRPSKDILMEFLDLGFKTVIVCVNDQFLDKSYAGRVMDMDFLKELPPNVDPCGENGEFHTFVFDGPLFSSPIEFRLGEIVHRKYSTATTSGGFWYCDLISP